MRGEWAGMATTRRRAPRARTAVAAMPRGAARARTRRLVRFLPSRHSLLVGFGVLAIAAGSYVAARETSLFAVHGIDVRGAPPALQREIERTLAPFRGTNLLKLDGAKLERDVAALPAVRSVSYDRAFPHTLRVTVVPETPVAVLHRGAETWLVSTRARVIAHIRAGVRPGLPRVWVPSKTPVAPGAILSAETGGQAAQALALAAHFPVRIAVASFAHGELVFRLRSGLQLVFGSPVDLRLKLAIARRALTLLPPGATYLDVSVPGRPVAGANPQVSSRG